MVTFSARKRKTKPSIVAGFLILSMLAGVLSACTMIVATPTPNDTTGAELIPSQDLLAPQEATLASPTEVATETPTLILTPEPTITLTPEPTLTPTQGIAFEIPDAPQNVDPEKWREAYISGMQSGGYLRLKIEAGLVKPFWDEKMDTLIWDLDGEKFGYNSEFKFTGNVAKDIYDNDWIVRKRLFSGEAENNSIWRFDKLHLCKEDDILLGSQCFRGIFDLDVEICALVGQVVGRESVDMKKYLTEDFYKANEFEAGIFYGEKNLNFEFLVVRFPDPSGTVDLKIPVCITEKCDEEMIAEIDGQKSNNLTGIKIFNGVKNGSMVYLTLSSVNEAKLVGDYESFRKSHDDVGSYVHEAFGWGELTTSTVMENFNIILSGKFLEEPLVFAPIFDLDKLIKDKITSFPAAIKIK